MMVSSVFLIATFSVVAADVTIRDGAGDVCSVDFRTGEATVVNSSPYIDVDNIDLIKANYTQQGIQATLSLQVVGNIENRGEIIDLFEDVIDINTVEYDFQLITSEQDYLVSYSNETGQLLIGGYEQINLTSSDFSAVGDTLTISFVLTSADEIYSNLSVTSTYLKVDLSDEASLVFLSDVAPNPPLTIYDAYASNIGSIGESIQFNASVEPLTGTPPYTYHWDFGDESTSTQLNPTHTYTKVGIYTYTFTVTDSGEATASKSDTITIYELKKEFLFGRFMNMKTEGDYITVEAVNLRMVLFKPFQFLHYITGEKIAFSNQYNGIIISNHFLIGMFNVVIGPIPPPVPPPNIACTTDSTTNRITIATAGANIKWRDIAITLDKPGATYQVFYVNGTAIAPVNNTAAADVAEVTAGEYIQLSTYSGNVRTTLRYIPTNSLIGTWTVNV